MFATTVNVRSSYGIRVGDALSQLANVIFLNGDSEESISGRAARVYVVEKQDNTYWKAAYTAINALFFWQNDHCLQSFSKDVARAYLRSERFKDHVTFE